MSDNHFTLGSYVEIFTDGGANPNPGPGGYGAILRYNGTEKELSGGEKDSTNNRMELMAAIKALEALTRSSKVVLTTDSQYLKNGITKWIGGWKKKNYKGVKNPELWQRLDTVAQKHDIRWCWVKGHSGHPDNERCDILATQAMQKYR